MSSKVCASLYVWLAHTLVAHTLLAHVMPCMCRIAYTVRSESQLCTSSEPASPLAAQVVKLRAAGAQLVGEQRLGRLVGKHAGAAQQECEHRLRSGTYSLKCPCECNVA